MTGRELAVAATLAAFLAGAPSARAQAVDHPASPAMGDPAAAAAPGPFKPDAGKAETAKADAAKTDAVKTDAVKADAAVPDVWIFSGTLQSSHESFSGTLVASGGKAQFELKLGGGATCDGGDVSGEVGLVRLSEIKCSDDRVMRALFVPQAGSELKVFGHVGDERFVTSAHLLGTDPVPEKGQTAQPKGPMGLPPAPSDAPPASVAPPAATAPAKP